jgi:hypothetical protein
MLDPTLAQRLDPRTKGVWGVVRSREVHAKNIGQKFLQENLGAGYAIAVVQNTTLAVRYVTNVCI